jgi:hypothetical protein
MMDEHYDDDVAIRSHYPSDFKLTMSKRYPPAKRQLSPLSRRRRKIQGGVSKNKTVKRPKRKKIGQPWITTNLARIPQLTLKPHEKPPPPPSPIVSKRMKRGPSRTKNQKESTLRAVQRWKDRKNYRINRTKVANENETIDSMLGKNCRQTTTTLSNELSLFLCDVSGQMIKEFRKFDEDLSGELSKEEFEALMDDLRKRDNFKLSRQDADLLYLAFDDDQSGSVTTREVVEGLFKCHHRCPTNILGQRLLPRKVREHHDEKHGLTSPPMGYSYEQRRFCGNNKKENIYEPLLIPSNVNGNKNEIPFEYRLPTPTKPTLPRYQMSPSRRRFNFLYTSDVV